MSVFRKRDLASSGHVLILNFVYTTRLHGDSAFGFRGLVGVGQSNKAAAKRNNCGLEARGMGGIIFY